MGRGRDILYAAGLGLASPVWGWKLLRTGKWKTDWASRLGRGESLTALPAKGPGVRRILIHAVSVGETALIGGLVKELLARDASLELVIASTTNTGAARALAMYSTLDRVRCIRYPLDFSGAVARFLDHAQPDLVATVELEVWPNFTDACAARGVPLVVVNGRLSARSFKGYRKFRRVIGPTFAKLTRVAAQTRDYAERFIAMGVPTDRVSVLDTMKWDTAVIEPAAGVAGADELARELGIDRSRKLIVAGSTSPGEEKLLVETCPPGVQLLIAPRKPEWFDAVMKVAPGAVRRTSGTPAPPEWPGKGQRVFLLDTIGELRRAYALADVCIVGRSFMGDLYGSDMMEPVALGKPTLIGPHYADFADTMRALTEADGIVVTDTPGPESARLLADPERARQIAERGREVIRSRQGATARHADLLLGMLDGSAETATYPEPGD
ncbi:MAG: 3-deoxy-D-manno-octulosonic acid transferase [Phycisphaerales bacterium JB063]